MNDVTDGLQLQLHGHRLAYVGEQAQRPSPFLPILHTDGHRRRSNAPAGTAPWLFPHVRAEIAPHERLLAQADTLGKVAGRATLYRAGTRCRPDDAHRRRGGVPCQVKALPKARPQTRHERLATGAGTRGLVAAMDAQVVTRRAQRTGVAE